MAGRIQLHLIEVEQRKVDDRMTAWVNKETGQPPNPGDMFACPPGYMRFLPPLTKKWDPTRPPWIIVLPGGPWWAPEGQAYNESKGYHGEGWDVSGEPPNLTIRPSILTAGYHGYVTNGWLEEC